MIPHEPSPLVGESPALRRARDLIVRYAKTNFSVLVLGATGTGKELVAQHLHSLSGRGGELVDVDCGALPATLVEALLFGHAPRAFTGAKEARAGLIEAAAGGTLFLDELGSLPLDGQKSLLRVLETRRLRRVGETVWRSVDFRLIATVQQMGELLHQGSFRRDLYHRLAGIVIELPPLAERLEDVAAIATHYAAAQGRRLEPGSIPVLRRYHWPGNVRELCQVLQRAGQLVENGTLPPSVIAEAIELGAPGTPATPKTQEAEIQRIAAVGAVTGWNATSLARALGIHRATLFRRLQALGVSLRGIQESQSH